MVSGNIRHEVGGPNFKRAGKANNGVQAGRFVAILNNGDVISAAASKLGKLLLGEPSFEPYGPEFLGKQTTGVCVWHCM
jgi:hypothetical protein